MSDGMPEKLPIPGVGAGGRMLAMPLCLLTVVLVILQLVLGELQPVDQVIAVGAALLASFVAWRSVGLGLVVGRSQTVVRSWFVSRRFDTEDVTSVGVAPYSGLLNDGDLDGSGRFLKVIVLTVVSDQGSRSFNFRGSVGFTKNVERRAARADELIRAFQER